MTLRSIASALIVTACYTTRGYAASGDEGAVVASSFGRVAGPSVDETSPIRIEVPVAAEGASFTRRRTPGRRRTRTIDSRDGLEFPEDPGDTLDGWLTTTLPIIERKRNTEIEVLAERELEFPAEDPDVVDALLETTLPVIGVDGTDLSSGMLALPIVHVPKARYLDKRAVTASLSNRSDIAYYAKREFGPWASIALAPPTHSYPLTPSFSRYRKPATAAVCPVGHGLIRALGQPSMRQPEGR